MSLKELAEEFEFDCRVRELSDRTVKNYQKQIAYFIDYAEEKHSITELERISPIHIKDFIGSISWTEISRRILYGNFRE